MRVAKHILSERQEYILIMSLAFALDNSVKFNEILLEPILAEEIRETMNSMFGDTERWHSE